MLNKQRRTKRTITPAMLMIIFLLIISFLLFYYNALWSTDGNQVKKIVNEFYEFEQNGNFGGSWELFHSSMHEKFTKEAYIQKRAQVFMQQLSAATFEFEINKVKSIGTWGMSETTPALRDVQRIDVTQHMLTVFGELELNQEIFAVEEDGEWKLLWSYHETEG